jgi:hypothetical protein
MALQAIDSHDPIRVDRIIGTIYSEPGCGKTTLGNMASKSLNVDFDKSVHRSLGRQKVLRAETWDDTEAVFSHPYFAEAELVVLDTVGRALDCLADSIIASDSKLGSSIQGLSQRGYGALKGRFKLFLNRLKGAGKDVLLIAHAKTEKDAQGNKTAYPDIQGSSAGEIYKFSDFIAYYSVQGGKRVLDFNATDNHIGKNPAGWEPLVVPPFASDGLFLSGVYQRLKDHLNELSAEQTAVLSAIADWSAKVEEIEGSPEAMTLAVKAVESVEAAAVKASVKTLLWRKAKALGLDFDKATQAFVKKSA